MARSQQIKIAADLLQTASQLASDSKIGVNRTMQDQCHTTAFFQPDSSLKLVGCILNFV